MDQILNTIVTSLSELIVAGATFLACGIVRQIEKKRLIKRLKGELDLPARKNGSIE